MDIFEKIDKTLHKGSTPSKSRIILRALMSQRFDSWYSRKFIPFVEGDNNAISESEILEDIREIFKV